MNSPILKTALIISALVAAPRAIAAQQIDRATAPMSAAEPARTHAKRTSGWGQITANMLVSVQYLNGVNATLRFGTGRGGGAILVATRR